MNSRLYRYLRILACVPLLAGGGHVHADAAKAGRFYEDALVRFQGNDVPGAIIQLKNALQQDRDMLAAHLLLAKAYLSSGDVGPAEVEFKEALRLGADREVVVVPLAQIYLMQGRYQLLIDSIKPDGLSLPAKVDVLSLRGTALGNVGKSIDATRSFEEARALDPLSPVPLLAEVPRLIAGGELDVARVRAERVVELAPDLAAAHNALASVKHAAGDLAGALAGYEKAISLQPGFVDAVVARAGILIDLSRDAEAVSTLAVLDTASEPRVRYLQALLATRRGDATAASRYMEEAAGLVDALPSEWLATQEQILMVGALAHYSGRQYEKARKYLEALTGRYPRNIGARRLLAAVLVDMGEYPRAATLLDQVLRDLPDDPQTLHLLGRVQLAQKRYARATELFERALAAGGRSSELQASLGASRLGQGERAAGISNLKAAFEHNPQDLGVAVTLANLLVREGQKPDALAVATRVVEALPDDPSAHNLFGLIKASTGDAEGARQAYVEAVRKSPGFMPAQLNLIRADIEAGRLDEARSLLDTLLRKNKRDGIAMYEMAMLEQRAGRHAEASRWVERAAAERPNDVRIVLGLVELRSAAGDRVGAREAAYGLALRRKGDLGVMAALANTEIAAGDLRSAQQTLREITALAEFDATALVRIGYLQLAAANPDAAVYAARKAMQGRPADLAAMALMVQAERMRKDSPAVDSALQALRKQHPGSSIGMRLAGDVAMDRGQPAQAVERYRQAFELQPDFDLVTRLASAHVLLGKPEQGAVWVRRWLQRAPDDMSAYSVLAELEMRKGDWVAARRGYEKVVASGRFDARTLNNLANVLIHLGEGDPVALAQQALAMAPGDVAIVDTLGWALARAGRYDEAIRHLRDARLRAPQDAEIRWHLGFALARQGRADEARAELQAALQDGALSAWTNEARELLKKL